MQKDRSAIVSALEKKGFEKEQGGRDHDFFFFRHDGLERAIYTKVSRGSAYKTIQSGLLTKMAKQLQLTTKQFGQLVDCPMTQEDYERHLREAGILR